MKVYPFRAHRFDSKKVGAVSVLHGLVLEKRLSIGAEAALDTLV